jgi:uncharacterized protein with FMN-binding domain
VKKIIVVMLAIFVAVCLLFTACFVDLPAPPEGGRQQIGNYTGTGVGTAWGHEGGIIRVTLIMEDGWITVVTIIDGADGTDPETPYHWDPVKLRAEAFIMAWNSVEIDNVAGSTVSADAVRIAARAALRQIMDQ